MATKFGIFKESLKSTTASERMDLAGQHSNAGSLNTALYLYWSVFVRTRAGSANLWAANIHMDIEPLGYKIRDRIYDWHRSDDIRSSLNFFKKEVLPRYESPCGVYAKPSPRLLMMEARYRGKCT